MDLIESLRQIRESLGDHPRRVIASAMGVFWGSAAIVLLMAYGTGFREFMTGELAHFGRGTVLVYPASTSSGFPGYRRGVRVRISAADIARVERDHRDVLEAVLPQYMSEGRVLVEADDVVRRLDLSASDARFAYYRSFDLAHGRFFDAREVARARAVAVLGNEAARDLFGRPGDAIGRRIRVEGRSFEVVGVAAPKGRQYTNTNRPDNRLLIIPYTAAQKRLGYPEEELSNVLLYPRPGVPAERAVEAALASLGRLAGFHPDDRDAVKWYDTATILGLVDLFYAGFMVFIGIAGSITLLIGGVGIANYHLATIAERTTEIAVAKALGARNRRLVAETVVEAVVVAAGASGLGVALGLAACAGLSAIAPPGEFPQPIVSGVVTAIAFAATAAVAVVSAAVPAVRVRRIEIGAALRAST